MNPKPTLPATPCLLGFKTKQMNEESDKMPKKQTSNKKGNCFNKLANNPETNNPTSQNPHKNNPAFL